MMDHMILHIVLKAERKKYDWVTSWWCSYRNSLIIHTAKAFKASFSCGEWILYAKSFTAICGPSSSCVTFSQNDATSKGSGLSTKGFVALTVR